MIINNKPYIEVENQYFKIPNDFGKSMTALKLKPNDRLIYLTLIRFASNEERTCYPSFRRLKEYTGISSDATIISSIKRLEEAGLVVKLSQGSNMTGKANVYQVNYVHGVPEASALKVPAKKKRTTQKQQRMTEPIPFKRGVHADFITQAEAQKNIKEAEAVVVDVDQQSRINALFGL